MHILSYNKKYLIEAGDVYVEKENVTLPAKGPFGREEEVTAYAVKVRAKASKSDDPEAKVYEMVLYRSYDEARKEVEGIAKALQRGDAVYQCGVAYV